MFGRCIVGKRSQSHQARDARHQNQMPVPLSRVLSHLDSLTVWISREISQGQMSSQQNTVQIDVHRLLHRRRRILHGRVVRRFLEEFVFRGVGDPSVGHDMINPTVRTQ